MIPPDHAEKVTGLTALTGGIISSILAMNAQSLAAVIGAVVGASVAFIALVANIMITIHFKKLHLKIIQETLTQNNTPNAAKNMCSLCPHVRDANKL